VATQKFDRKHLIGRSYQLRPERGDNQFSKVWGETVSSVDQLIDYDKNGNIKKLSRNGYYESGTANYLMDELNYTYDTGNDRYNRLSAIEDIKTGNGHGSDFTTTGADGYTYNSMGQLTASDAEAITSIAYNPFGQVKEVIFSGGENSRYKYGPSAQRIKSELEISASSVYTWYVRDVSGNIMSIYKRDESGTDDVAIEEQPLYGLGRMGTLYKSTDQVIYQLSDHLGNVRVTFSWNDVESEVDIESWADYYPFGAVMPGRSGVSSPGYRYSYQGQENSENSDWHNFQLRSYNASLGRFQTIDPYGQHHSPYLAMSNNPIGNIDPSGGQDYKALRYNEAVMAMNDELQFQKAAWEASMGLPGNYGVLDMGGGGGGIGGGGGGYSSPFDSPFGFGEGPINPMDLSLSQYQQLESLGGFTKAGRNFINNSSYNAQKGATGGWVNAQYITTSGSTNYLMNPVTGDVYSERYVIQMAFWVELSGLKNYYKYANTYKEQSGGSLTNPTGLGIRNDSQGQGHYGASRGSRIHKGVDFSTVVGQDIYAPIDGKVVYATGKSKGARIDFYPTNPSAAGFDMIRMLYVDRPAGVNAWGTANVQAGAAIGIAADLQTRGYSSSVTPHIHLQIQRGTTSSGNPNWIDPTPFFFGP
jgi:RHS repeat-associated protein